MIEEKPMLSDEWEAKKREQFLKRLAASYDEGKKRERERLEQMAEDEVFLREAYVGGNIVLQEFKTGPAKAYIVKRDEYGLWDVSRGDRKPVPKSFSGKHTTARRAWDAIRKGTAETKGDADG